MGFLVAVQLLIAMLFYPLRIGAYGHVSLARDKIDLNVTVLGLSIARLRVKRESGRFKLLVNGKPFKTDKKISVGQLKSIGRQYKIEGLKLRGSLLALIGTQDAKNTAMLCALANAIAQPLSQGFNAYTAITSDTFEIDGRVNIKINLLQIASLAFAGLRGSNG
ncbi:MAG: hypothetical protein NC037_05225 [Bacteroides sp.]|nr:hypothetical protein [Bacillota bacterium]MCM1393925.1 hypothetical protein [[Eubacterium] siraeum]MCM1455908.1 hypothetical protein [Bacteroides sp.]